MFLVIVIFFLFLVKNILVTRKTPNLLVVYFICSEGAQHKYVLLWCAFDSYWMLCVDSRVCVYVCVLTWVFAVKSEQFIVTRGAILYLFIVNYVWLLSRIFLNLNFIYERCSPELYLRCKELCISVHSNGGLPALCYAKLMIFIYLATLGRFLMSVKLQPRGPTCTPFSSLWLRRYHSGIQSSVSDLPTTKHSSVSQARKTLEL